MVAGIWAARRRWRGRGLPDGRRPRRDLAGRVLAGCAAALVLAGAPSGCAGGAGGAAAREAGVWPPAGSRVFSPYADVTLAAPFDLAGVGMDAGARSLTLAFVVATAGSCRPAWGEGTAIGAPAVARAAARLRAAGVALRVSFGGAAGQELAARCRNVERLRAAYASVLGGYHALAADFDLEGAALSDSSAMARRARAIAQLQAHAGSPLGVSLTLPVTSRGLSPSGLAAVRAMLGAGVHLGIVNLLAMDYGLPGARGRMAAEAISAIRAAHRQLLAFPRTLSRWGSLGVTVMVGVNDVAGEVLTLADARTVAGFARRQGLGLTSIWSLARDGPCAGSRSSAVPRCSGVKEPPYAFSRAFGARPKPGAPVRRAVEAS